MNAARLILRIAAIGACAAVFAGCSLLVDTGLEGHPCGADGTCLSGYGCDTSSNLCVNAAELACSPACPPTEVCIQKQCVDKCAAEACAPGSTCQNGACQNITASDVLGSQCTQDADCGESGLYCLQPYGSQLSGLFGVCTEVCSVGDNPCTVSGEICQTFTSDSPTTLELCADPSLKPCARDSDCSATPGFVCGVAHINTLQLGTLSAAICVPAPASMASPGATCSLGGGTPCANGLCVLGNGTENTYYCTEPCQSTSDCGGFPSGATLSCAYVTLTENAPMTATHAEVCIEGSSSFDTTCNGTGNPAQCTADAPNCIPSAGNSSVDICAPYCGDGIGPAQCDQTPQGGNTSLSCSALGQCN